MKDCIFCKIVKKDAKADVVKETDDFIVFKDVNPQAAIHYLIVPKKHVKDLTELGDDLWKELKTIAVYMSRDKGLSGFRLLHNAGDAATIPHMQMHFLADIDPERAV